MNKSDFFKNLFDYSKRENFSFFIPGEQFNDPERLSESRQKIYKLMFASAIGIGGAIGGVNSSLFSLGILKSGDLNSVDRDALIKDLSEIHDYCDLVGIKLNNGPAVLRVAIDADDISDASLEDYFAQIHSRAHNFRKHSSFLLKGPLGNETFSVHVHGVVVFSAHNRANDFIQRTADKCRHSAFWKKIYTAPWVVDLESEEIKRYRQLDGLFGGGVEKLKAEFFRK